MTPAVSWTEPLAVAPVEFVRVTEAELAEAVALGCLTAADLPYHDPLHAEGVCVGCDARRRRRDAMLAFHGAA